MRSMRCMQQSSKTFWSRRSVSMIALTAFVLLGSGIAIAASPVTGSVSGPVTSVKGQTFKLKTSLSSTGSSTVQVSSATVITVQATGSRADLKKGACLTALGQKNSKGVIVATRIMLSQPVKGQCSSGFGRGDPQGAPPQPPPGGTGGAGGVANFGFANGAISAIKGSSVTVHNQSGSTSVTISSKTLVTKTIRGAASAVKVKMCAFVRGTSANKRVTVKAQNVSLSQPGASGCTPQARRP
jgi:hypothetical protein